MQSSRERFGTDFDIAQISETELPPKENTVDDDARGILAPRAHARSTERSTRAVSHHNPFARRIRAVPVSSHRGGTRGETFPEVLLRVASPLEEEEVR